MVSRPALHRDGGQALDLLTIGMKTDSDKQIYRGILRRIRYIGLLRNYSGYLLVWAFFPSIPRQYSF
jgi:hypothetical protein